MNNKKKLLYFGGAGSVLAAIACFTPVLVVLLSAVGLAAWLSWADFVLFPALAIFLVITAYAAFRLMRGRGTPGETPAQNTEGRQP